MKVTVRVAHWFVVLVAVAATSVTLAFDRSGGGRYTRDFDRTGGNHYILCVHPCPDAARWVATANLNVARSYHTATLLPNGKVLATGGRSTTGLLASAELYDPATGTWSLTGSMNVPRVLHTATLLPNGKVLIVGGETSKGPSSFGATDTTELYDPSTGTWSLTGNMDTIRCCYTVTLLQNGTVLVAGGFNTDNIGTVEVYDPATGGWSLTSRMIKARWGHTATLLQDGRVLVARGSDDGDLASTLSSAELYDPVAGTWTALADSSAGSVFHTATLLPDGKVLIVGGNTGGIGGDGVLAISELFDPATGSWSKTGNLTAERYSHTATLLPTGEVLVAGGENQQNHYPHLSYNDLYTAELYDSVTRTWTRTDSLVSARAGHTATLLPDGQVLIAGGAVVGPGYTTIELDSAELYQRSP
jgi:N-acetylneuraminic acid mutarotase